MNESMGRVDLGKLEAAILYVERITEGYNPVNCEPVGEGDVFNDPNVIRCMYFIRDVLEEVRRNDGLIGVRKAKSGSVLLPIEVLDEFQYVEDKSITHLLKQIHAPVNGLDVKKISFVRVTNWLKEDGYLEEIKEKGTGKTKNFPTEEGEKLGIYVREREYEGRLYQTVMYDENAQKYVVERIRSWMAEQR